MDLLQSIALGIVQGLGEFLPISSSAHLVLTPWLFCWDDPGLVFDVALHVGTLVAVVSFFWRDWIVLLLEGLHGSQTRDGRLFWYLVVATIPGAVAGYLLEEQAATIFREPLLVGSLLIGMGVLLWAADHFAASYRGLYDMRMGTALFIGISQALAIIPGVSRSGATMMAARLAGMEREPAARFSFLLSTPIILGAALFQMRDITVADLSTVFLAGVLTSAVVGFLAIGFMLRWVTRHSFNLFVWYRFVLGAIVLAVALLRG